MLQAEDDREIDDEEEKILWKIKLLHGMYHWQIEQVADIKKSYHRLEKVGPKEGTEALIMAAQEHALSPKSIGAEIFHSQQYPIYRLCKDTPEIVTTYSRRV